MLAFDLGLTQVSPFLMAYPTVNLEIPTSEIKWNAPLQPDRYTGLLILSANIDLWQIYQYVRVQQVLILNTWRNNLKW